MTLSAGTRLGPYEVAELLGAGGMGAVYRARDPRLGRDIAIKVLPDDIAADPDRLRRFELEAKAVAALNHPHILTVHDVGTHEGTPYVVTELLEGETLREVLTRRSPTQRQVLSWGVQTAQGLAAAHRKGIVHRDLKPENLFLTTEGRMKILDFGLAKLTAAAIDREEVTESNPSRPGVLMGTVAYMSPEQVQARPVDARSDLFSFGVVLYEMLARRHPFRHDTVAATLSAILQETPSQLTLVDASIPPAVDGIVRRCLEKGREERFQGAHDLSLALEAVLAAPTGSAFLQEVEERSPYPGLSSFTEKEAGVFFGRESEVKALWDRIRGRRLLAVIGPSGVGKTSFLRAGVLPSRSEGWTALVCTPGTTPFRGLGQALGPALAGDAEALGQLAGFEDSETALALLSRWRRSHTEALVVVDQFEELFTLNPLETQQRFAALLGRLAREADVHVLLSLRDDFLIRCSDQPPLVPVFSEITPLTALTRDGLERAVVEPAKKQGYRFDDDALVGEMVSLVEGVRGALPLLAFAVARLWEKRDRERKLLTREAYQDIAGVEGALAQHAEATMDRIGPERQNLVREVFRNLVTAQGTRAVIDREELLSAFPERKAAEEVLNQLVDARLLTTYEVEGKEGEPSHHRVEVVHESLLKAWPRLVRWQAQDEEGALLRDQLKQAAHLWDEKGRKADLLWTGTAFTEYELWRSRYPGALTALEEDFARSMAERARRKRRILLAAAAATLVAVGSVAVAVTVLWQRAVRAARRAEASRLVALGRNELDRHPSAALAFARRSLETADTSEARRLAVEALWRAPALRVLPVDSPTVTVAFSPDGTKLATFDNSGKILVFRDDGSPPLSLGGFLKEAPGVKFLAFTPAGDAVLGWSWNREVPIRMVSVADGRELRTFGPRLPGGGPGHLGDAWVGDAWAKPAGLVVATVDGPGRNALVHLRLEPYEGGEARWLSSSRVARLGVVDDGLTRLALLRKGRVLLRSVAGDERTPERPVTTLEEPNRGAQLAFDPSGDTLAVAEPGPGRLTLWSSREASDRPARTLRLGNPDAGFQPTFDDRGARIAWGSSTDGAVSIWELDGPPDAAARVLRRPDVIPQIYSMAFQPRGPWLAVPQVDTVSLWLAGQPWPRVLTGHSNNLSRVRFTPDSGRLVSCARDALGVWPLRPGIAPDQGSRRWGGLCYGLAMTPDGKRALWGAIAVRLSSLDDGTGTDWRPPRSDWDDVSNATAVDPSGRWGATSSDYTRGGARKIIRVWDLASGAVVREWPQAPEGESVEGSAWASEDIDFLRDGRLVAGQWGGLRVLDARTGGSQWLWTLPSREGVRSSVSADGRVVAAFRTPGAGAANWDGVGDVVLFDVETGGRRAVASHGSRFASLALDADGSVLVTGDLSGAVRVGPSDGREPHLLCCHPGRVDAVAVSPDRKWVASASGNEIRLWPMPDLAKAPPHSLPYTELMARLRALTNLQVVEDATSPTGYKVDIGPFPGWKDVPSW